MSVSRILAVFILVSSPTGLLAQDEVPQQQPRQEEASDDDAWAQASEPGLEFHGFVEGAFGTRLYTDEVAGFEETLEELRFRAELAPEFGRFSTSFKADVLYDGLAENEFEIQLREALVAFTAGDADMRFGRQVLTWGTGDLVFLNDLFPKDWVSFFAGREVSFLKYPSDSLKFSIYKPAVNLDVVWTPVFTPDQFLTGERFTYYSPNAGAIVGAPPAIDPQDPPQTLENGELALRLHRTLGSRELAFYSYRGFFKQPVGFDPTNDQAIFPALSVWGASLRSPLWGGIANTEVAWYDSRDDREGSDPLIPNSQYKILIGYELELVSKLNLGLQYYLEGLTQYDRLLAGLPPESTTTAPDELRHVITTRWTLRTHQDSITWSLFVFYSPSAEDWFAMPGVGYRISDRWQWDGGLNIFGGRDRHTFFGQFEDNSNIYTRLRFNF